MVALEIELHTIAIAPLTESTINALAETQEGQITMVESNGTSWVKTSLETDQGRFEDCVVRIDDDFTKKMVRPYLPPEPSEGFNISDNEVEPPVLSRQEEGRVVSTAR